MTAAAVSPWRRWRGGAGAGDLPASWPRRWRPAVCGDGRSSRRPRHSDRRPQARTSARCRWRGTPAHTGPSFSPRSQAGVTSTRPAPHARAMLCRQSTARRQAARQPLLWVVEDAHWIDPTTLGTDRAGPRPPAGPRVLAVVDCAPTFAATFASHPVVSRLALNRLARAATGAIVARIAGGKPLPPLFWAR